MIVYLFFRHDISTSHTDPAVKAIMEACIAENDVDRLVSNLQVITSLSTHVCVCICLSVCLIVCLSICLSVYLSA